MALDEGLGLLNRGVQEVIGTMAARQQCPIIYVAGAQHRFPCKDCIKELVESNKKEVANRFNIMSGLHIFILPMYKENNS